MTIPSDELRVLLDKLTKEVYLGRMHLWIWRHLNNALVAKEDVGQMAPAFFQLTLRAHCDEAFLHLARLFDKRRGAVNLRMLLGYMDRNAGRFQKAAPERVRAQLLPALRENLKGLEIQVVPVLNRRNNILAHLDPRGLIDFEAVAKEAEITIGSMESLYEKSGEIVNEVSGCYNGSSTVMELIGWNDFENVLELMQRGKRTQLEDLEKESGKP